MKNPPPTLKLIDRKQIAEMLAIKVDTFRRRVETRPDFPKPALRQSRETVRWDQREIDEWLRRQMAAARR